jgi:Zn-finger domain-containing protein
MNNKELNIALGKLFNGIELDTHKVELNIVDDFEKAFSKANDIESNAILQTVNITNAINKAIDIYKEAGKAYLRANASYQKIEQMTKELGVEPQGKIKAYAEEVSKSIKTIDQEIKKLKKAKATY